MPPARTTPRSAAAWPAPQAARTSQASQVPASWQDSGTAHCLLLVGFAGALRRSELVAVDHAHLRFDADCVVIHIPRSKRDQEGKGADITLPRMRRGGTGAGSDTGPTPCTTALSDTCIVLTRVNNAYYKAREGSAATRSG